MDFKESASMSVMMIYAAMNVFVAVSTVFLVVYMTSASSSPGSILGSSCSMVVPGSTGKPFSSLAKNVPSIIVATILSFWEPIETCSGVSNLS